MIIPEIIYIYFYIQINNEKAFNLNIENKYQMNIKKIIYLIMFLKILDYIDK